MKIKEIITNLNMYNGQMFIDIESAEYNLNDKDLYSKANADLDSQEAKLLAECDGDTIVRSDLHEIAQLLEIPTSPPSMRLFISVPRVNKSFAEKVIMHEEILVFKSTEVVP